MRKKSRRATAVRKPVTKSKKPASPRVDENVRFNMIVFASELAAYKKAALKARLSMSAWARGILKQIIEGDG
jgi:hypothetical protein